MKILRESGKYLKRKAIQNLSLAILCLMLFAGIFLSSVPPFPFYINLGSYNGVRTLATLFPLIGTLLFQRKYRRYKHGLEGENHVTKTLSSTLNDEYYLINDVWLPDGKKGNIDHIVLGPTGIFAVETKNQTGKIECNGDVWNGVIGRNPSKQARDNAFRVHDAIASSEIFKSRKLWVQGVVVFANKDVDLDVQNPHKVDILKSDGLVNYILAKESNLSSQEIELVGKEILKQMQTF